MQGVSVLFVNVGRRRYARWLTCLLAVSIFVVSNVFAQVDRNANTFHVFPEIADGVFSDGSYFQTHLLATNVNLESATCTYNLYGLSTTRLQGANRFVLAGFGAYYLLPTTGTQFSVASGYASLGCDRPVTAILLYSYVTRFGLTAVATVFPSQSGTRAQLFVDQRTGSRLGVAIANDTSSASNYQIIVANASGIEVGRRTITVNAKSSASGFVDEFVALPPAFAGTVAIYSPSGSPFSVIGLIFSGALFTTEPATMLLP
jgi:hypothetical protein